MTIEAGARAGLIACDQTTLDYVKGRPFAPRGEIWDKAVSSWSDLHSDTDAVFEQEVLIDAGDIAPQVTWGTSPEMVCSVNGRVPDPATEADPIKAGGMQTALDYVEVIGDIYAELPITPRALPSSELDAARQLHRDGVRLHHVEAGLLVATARRVLGNEPQALKPLCSLRDVVPIIEQARRAGVRQSYVDYLRHKLRHVLETYGAASAKARARARSRASPRR
jgi:3-isopropylmalate/(R)-2-methylmalate dehydratase large subunit